MKFCINKEIGYVNPDRVRILKRDEDYFGKGDMVEVEYLCNVIVKVTEDWNPKDHFPIVSGTCSIQYRPKGIFTGKKGYYYKEKGKTTYLTKEEVDNMMEYILEAIKYLK